MDLFSKKCKTVEICRMAFQKFLWSWIFCFLIVEIAESFTRITTRTCDINFGLTVTARCKKPKLTKRKASNLLNLGKWVKKRRVNEGDKESHKNDKKKENVSHFSIYLSC